MYKPYYKSPDSLWDVGSYWALQSRKGEVGQGLDKIWPSLRWLLKFERVDHAEEV
jgi:hypothetical protein